MTTSSLREIWKLLEHYQNEAHILQNKDVLTILLYIAKHKTLSKKYLFEHLSAKYSEIEKILSLLDENGYINHDKENISLTIKANDIVQFVYNSSINISNLPENAIDGYILLKPFIGKGSTSVTFCAKRLRNGRTVVLKIFKPGVLTNIDFENQIKEISNIEIGNSRIVIPYDWGKFSYENVELNFIEMKYVQGESLQDFLSNNKNIDIEETIRNFILEVGSTLRKLHDLGYKHGDLHSKNILVVEDEIEQYKDRGVYHFMIIDFIGIDVRQEFSSYQKSDFEYFTEDLMRIIRRYCLTESGVIDKKKLGARLSFVYENIKNNKYDSISALMNGLSDQLPKMVSHTIKPPFSYLIFETYDIKDPNWLKAFEPDYAIYQSFINFKPLICSGPRGVGKSIYLRSLSFIPQLIKEAETDSEIKDKIAYFKNIFGIYFPCRQGEFKYFTDKQYDFSKFETQLFLKHILVLRVMRRTIALISEGYEENVFNSEPKVQEIIPFITKYLLIKDIAFTTPAPTRYFKELATILRNEENHCIDLLGKIEAYPNESSLLNENLLIEFFSLCKSAIVELKFIKFYIIFDDVSEPQINLEVQKLLNCLITCHNEVYCCKFSTDKYAYTYEDMFGKALQVPHDYTYIDISDVEDFEKYLEKIINLQLRIVGYKKDIKSYLEDNKYTNNQLIGYLANKNESKKVRYAGWRILVQLSNTGVRDGLAICDSIFKMYGDEHSHEILKNGFDTINVKIQDKGIRKYSEEVYASLINIESVGKEIFDIVRAFGEISRKLLERNITSLRNRRYEMITIERRDEKPLSEKARNLLGKLIRHSVFLDKGFSFSREQMGLVQKFTLHKKYSPNLKITFREREHLRLTNKELEKFLLEPDNFRKQLLLKKQNLTLLDLFDEEQ